MDGGGAPGSNPRTKAQLARWASQSPSLAAGNSYLPGSPGAARLAFPPKRRHQDSSGPGPPAFPNKIRGFGVTALSPGAGGQALPSAAPGCREANARLQRGWRPPATRASGAWTHKLSGRRAVLQLGQRGVGQGIHCQAGTSGHPATGRSPARGDAVYRNSQAVGRECKPRGQPAPAAARCLGGLALVATPGRSHGVRAFQQSLSQARSCSRLARRPSGSLARGPHRADPIVPSISEFPVSPSEGNQGAGGVQVTAPRLQ